MRHLLGMGYMRHHAVVVASNVEEDLQLAHDKASQIFPWVSPIGPGQANGYRAFFFIPPDGSKEGWPTSSDGDARRDDFFAWLDGTKSVAYPTEPLSVDWCEVAFGDDGGHDQLVRSNQVDNRAPTERTRSHGARRDYVKCRCGHHFVVYTYDWPDETTYAVGGYEPEAGVFCEACETVYEQRFDNAGEANWVPADTPLPEAATPGPRSRVATLGE